MDRRTLLYILGTLLFWSSAFAGIRGGLTGLTPGHLVLLRFVIASLVLLLWHVISGMPWPPRRLWGLILLAGFSGITVYQSLLTFGEQVVPAGTASFIVAAAPAFTVILAHTFLRERLSRRGYVGMGVSLIGVAIISLGSGTPTFHTSALMVVVAAVATAVFFVVQKPLLRQYPAAAVTSWVTWAGTLPLLVFLPGLSANFREAPPAAIWSVVYIGVLPGALAYVLWAQALKRADAGRVSSWLYANPFLATGIGWVWLGEVPQWTAVGGGLVVILGLLLVHRRSTSRQPQSKPTADSPSQA